MTTPSRGESLVDTSFWLARPLLLQTGFRPEPERCPICNRPAVVDWCIHRTPAAGFRSVERWCWCPCCHAQWRAQSTTCAMPLRTHADRRILIAVAIHAATLHRRA